MYDSFIQSLEYSYDTLDRLTSNLERIKTSQIMIELLSRLSGAIRLNANHIVHLDSMINLDYDLMFDYEYELSSYTGGIVLRSKDGNITICAQFYSGGYNYSIFDTMEYEGKFITFHLTPNWIQYKKLDGTPIDQHILCDLGYDRLPVRLHEWDIETYRMLRLCI